MSHLTYLEAMVVGLVQGVTELFPVSSLGHNVLIPALLGGSWAQDLNVSRPESPYLAFIVGLHVATALALLLFFWRDWIAIIRGLITSVRDRRVATPPQRLGWLIVLATIPVGISGLALEHLFRATLGAADSCLRISDSQRIRSLYRGTSATPGRQAAQGFGRARRFINRSDRQ
jgi:undecaprenyl-diphosphatase